MDVRLRQRQLLIGFSAMLGVASARIGLAQEVFWTERGPSCAGSGVHRMSAGAATADDLITSGSSISKILVDPGARHIYWSDGTVLRRSSLDRLDLVDVATVSTPFHLGGFALETANGHVYWLETVSCAPCGSVSCPSCPRVRRANLDGSDVQTVTTITGTITNPADIAVDPQAGKIYWSDRQFSPFVSRFNLDGSNSEPLVTTTQSTGGVNEITLDLVAGKIYWTEAEGGVPGDAGVSRSNLDGTGYEPLVTYVASMNRPRGIALDPGCGRFYWTLGGFCPDGTGSLLRANLDASRVDTIATGLGVTNSIAITPGTGTLPCGTQCVRAVSFDSLICRLGELQGQMSGASGLGRLRTGLVGRIGRASAKLVLAQTSCAQAKQSPARKALAKTSHLVGSVVDKIGSRVGRKIVDPSLSAEMLAAIAPIREDIEALRGVTCP